MREIGFLHFTGSGCSHVACLWFYQNYYKLGPNPLKQKELSLWGIIWVAKMHLNIYILNKEVIYMQQN